MWDGKSVSMIVGPTSYSGSGALRGPMLLL